MADIETAEQHCEWYGLASSDDWRRGWNACRQQLAARAERAEAAQRVPKGWRLVPVKPTPEMVEAICASHTSCGWPDEFGPTAQAIRRQHARDGYGAALLAAPAATEPCPDCNGTGELFIHADDCDDDLCALNGDEHSCGGQVIPCAQCGTAAEPKGARDAQE